MNVLLANSTCKVGGVSTFMLSLRSALAARGHTCELFFFDRGTMEPFLPLDARAHFGGLADCLRVVRNGRFDVVHANNVDWTTGISSVRQIGAALVVTAHKARASAWTYGWTASNCDALTAVSTGVARELQPYTDIPIHVVHNGIDLAWFHAEAAAPTSPPVIAWVGRSASPLKRLDKFAAIAPALHRAGFRLWIVDQHGVERAAEVLPEAVAVLRPLAEMWRAVPFEEMRGLYRDVAASGGCVVTTSSREGLGLAYIEAQACGCVVVGPDVQGVNEAVSPCNGGVLYPFDLPADDVARIIIAAVSDEAGMLKRQAAAAAFVRDHFSRDRMTADYLRIYAEAPYRASILPARLGARLRLSPLVHWNGYVRERWGIGELQYTTAQELAAAGEPQLAAAAMRSALQTGPTLFANPSRLRCLVHTLCRGFARPARSNGPPDSKESALQQFR
jgi:glycosyltransferase involved in cell wall biosynthesis